LGLSINPPLNRVWTVKTACELGVLRFAAAIASQGPRTARHLTRAGLSELEILNVIMAAV